VNDIAFTHSLCSSFNMTDQGSHPYKTKSKIIVLFILIVTFLDSKWQVIYSTKW